MQLKINGEEITAKDVEKQYEKIPEEVKANITENQVLDTMVTQKLLLHEADSKGIAATYDETDKYLGKLKTLNGYDDNTFKQQILKSGYTPDEYRKNVKDFLTESKLLNTVLDLKNVQASDQEVDSFIQKNKDEFQDIFSEGDPSIENFLKARIKQNLTQEKRRELVNDYIDSLRKKAKIE